MDYDEHFTDRCECGEPAVLLVTKPFYIQTKLRLIESTSATNYCLSCYAKKKANESMIEVRND